MTRVTDIDSGSSSTAKIVTTVPTIKDLPDTARLMMLYVKVSEHLPAASKAGIRVFPSS